MRRAIWHGVGCLMMVAAMASCGGRSGEDRPAIRFNPISPLGEPLAAPTRDAETYRATMRDWFGRTDTNHDGTLSLTELQAKADRLFLLYDLNHDGFVTSYELTQYRVNLPTHSAPADSGRRLRPGRVDMTPDEAATAQRDSRGRADYRMGVDPVMAADSNADFRVTPEELRAEVARRHGLMDKNRDSAVSLAEFMEHAEGPMRAWSQDR